MIRGTKFLCLPLPSNEILSEFSVAASNRIYLCLAWFIIQKKTSFSLRNNVLPIVMGAHPDDYKRAAPHKSYIHVDDFASPKELAAYLTKLDSDEEAYNDYFKWKGTGEFVNTHFFCRLCAMVHYADRSKSESGTRQWPRLEKYKDFNNWWRGPGVCTRRSWRNQLDIFANKTNQESEKGTTNRISVSKHRNQSR